MIRIIGGYAVAVFVALTTLYIFMEWEQGLKIPPVAEFVEIASWMLAATVLPFAIFIVAAERNVICNPVFYLLTGAATGPLSISLVLFALQDSLDLIVLPLVWASLVAGAAGGLAYWLTAGRNAGAP